MIGSSCASPPAAFSGASPRMKSLSSARAKAEPYGAESAQKSAEGAPTTSSTVSTSSGGGPGFSSWRTGGKIDRNSNV